MQVAEAALKTQIHDPVFHRVRDVAPNKVYRIFYYSPFSHFYISKWDKLFTIWFLNKQVSENLVKMFQNCIHVPHVYSFTTCAMSKSATLGQFLLKCQKFAIFVSQYKFFDYFLLKFPLQAMFCLSFRLPEACFDEDVSSNIINYNSAAGGE